MEAEERAEVGGALGELAAAFTGLVEVLLDGGQAQLTPTRIVEVAARVMPGCRHAAGFFRVTACRSCTGTAHGTGWTPR